MKTKLLAIVAVAAVFVGPAFGQSSHHVRGYTRADGTYVAPHQQTNPNSTTSDNWSTKGNVNPYTGKAGTVDPSPSADPYRAPSATYPKR